MFIFYQFQIYTLEVQKIRHLLCNRRKEAQRENEYPLAITEYLLR